MLRWFYVVAHLLVEAGAARRDARIRFLKAQVEILRRKLGGNRVIPSPDDRARLLAIGQELDYNVADVIGIVHATDVLSLGNRVEGRAQSQACRPAEDRPQHARHSSFAWPRKTPAGAIAASSANCGSSASNSGGPRFGEF